MTDHNLSSNRQFYRVREVPKIPEFSFLTESSLRHLIFQSEGRLASNGDQIAGNGMAEAGVIVRLGRRVLIDVQKLRSWLQSQGN